MENRKVLMLFSGGKDSFLSVCKLVEEGFDVILVTYKTLNDIGNSNVKYGVSRLIKRYGNKIKFYGIINTAGIIRNFIVNFYNMNISEILKKYGEINFSQFNCLVCRVSMYICSIIICKQNEISYVADGARKDQSFVIELPIMIKRFKVLFEKYNINFITPVYEINSDWDEKNQLINRGFVPKVFEPQCLMGVPLSQNKVPEKNIIEGVSRLYDLYILKYIDEIIENNKNILFSKDGKFY